MGEDTRELLRIIQGRLEGFAAGYSIEDYQYRFLMDTAELISNIINDEEDENKRKQ